MALMLSDGEMHPPGNAELQLGMCQKKSLERLHCEFHPAGPGSSQHIDFNDWGHPIRYAWENGEAVLRGAGRDRILNTKDDFVAVIDINTKNE